MTVARWDAIPDLLSALEDRELPRLTWGIVDGFLSRDEVFEVIDAQVLADLTAGVPGPTRQEFLDHLLQAGLLHRVADGMQTRYRTRLAEGLRLLRHLRLLRVPTDADVPGWWRGAPPLVADYRLRVAPRRYPSRTIEPHEVLDRLQSRAGWSSAASDVATALIGGRSLARFQVDAAESILEAIEGARTVARIVTAGTGSGKTLSFYLPAMLDLALNPRALQKTPHTLALYPRNELLRDQAREALLQIRRMNAVLHSGTRAIRMGLLYGAVPRDAKAFEGRRPPSGWRQTAGRDGWVAPYFPCLTDGCAGDLVWSDRDRLSSQERLTCSVCGDKITGSEIALTRATLSSSPPDLLFSTTEMLSRQSTGPLSRLLGWRGRSSIRLVLLDEAHTYSGVSGAQVALMLRRWRYANGQFGSPAPVFVGLSATLRDAGDYFAALTGCERADVEVIGPSDDELESTGREYGVVLRGDPASGTALLSTTIQSIMLAARLMDMQPGIYGASTFVFTDDLDVTNRLFDDFRDAEGYRNGRPNSRPRLADLRQTDQPQQSARYADGQWWELPQHLGRLPGGLQVGRTSSQDKGVDAVADVVIATSSLEVGFNDPRVGMVVQHKAPRDMASFLQRRGRAGRSLAMRPMSLVILSDYGRDRQLYQSYERILDPEIDARNLPVGNRYVAKVQATHALLDYAFRTLGSDIRRLLSQPFDPQNVPDSSALAALLNKILSDPAHHDGLRDFLQYSLRISTDEATAVMWDEPRSLLLAAIPTALKRLESGWRDDRGQPDRPGDVPLPEFMTTALFDALNSPDVLFDLPPALRTDDEAAIPIQQALRESAPGRVSRRFGYKHASHRAWMALPDAGSTLELTAVIAAGQDLGEWDLPDGQAVRVVRPLTLRLSQPPADVEDNSSASPVWRSAFEFPDAPDTARADVPDSSPWTALVDGCSFALHLLGNPLTMRRFTLGSDGETVMRGGSRVPHETRFTHHGEPAALGFELEVDAFVVFGDVAKLDDLDLSGFAVGPEWRTLAFRTRVQEDPRLADVTNYFSRELLADLFIVAYARNGLTAADRRTALAATANGAWRSQIGDYFRALYRTGNTDVTTVPKRVAQLEDLAQNPVVCAVLDEHAALLARDDVEDATRDLLRRTVLDTTASALIAAIHRRVPDAGEADLIVDVVLDQADGTFRIVVSETEIGGLGLLEEFRRDYVADPRRYWLDVSEACGPTDYEDVDETMRWVVSEADRAGSELASGIARYRRATTSAELDAAIAGIRDAIDVGHGSVTHLLMSTLASRILAPGGSASVDAVIAFLSQSWLDVEDRLGIEIDARVVALHAASGALGRSVDPLNADTAFGALWLRGPSARNSALDDRQPYLPSRLRERLVLGSVAMERSRLVDVTTDGWETEYLAAIQSDGSVRLTAPLSARTALAAAIRSVTTLPAEAGVLRVYGRVRDVRRQGVRWVATFSLDEGVQ